jgi:FtsZ-interacting cell division protein YlmF
LKQRESGREREREGERGRGSRERAEETEREREREGERERERERKAKTFKAREKMTFERALDLSSSLNILKNPRPNPLVVLFCVTSSACFTMTIRSHSDAGTIAEIPHYGIR